MKAHIDKNLCNSCGDCTRICLAVFLPCGEGNQPKVRVSEVYDSKLQELSRKAAEKCPTKAILIMA